MHIKDMFRYVTFEVEIIDDTKNYRTLRFCNRASVARILPGEIIVPLHLKQDQWNYLCLDLEDLTRRAFGTNYLTAVQLRVFSTCRIWKIFFEDREYSDAELPAYLQVVPASS